MVAAPQSLHEDPGQHTVVNVPPAFKYCSEIFFFFFFFACKKGHISYHETLVILKHFCTFLWRNVFNEPSSLTSDCSRDWQIYNFLAFFPQSDHNLVGRVKVSILISTDTEKPQ